MNITINLVILVLPVLKITIISIQVKHTVKIALRMHIALVFIWEFKVIKNFIMIITNLQN